MYSNALHLVNVRRAQLHSSVAYGSGLGCEPPWRVRGGTADALWRWVIDEARHEGHEEQLRPRCQHRLRELLDGSCQRRYRGGSASLVLVRKIREEELEVGF